MIRKVRKEPEKKQLRFVAMTDGPTFDSMVIERRKCYRDVVVFVDDTVKSGKVAFSCSAAMRSRSENWRN